MSQAPRRAHRGETPCGGFRCVARDMTCVMILLIVLCWLALAVLTVPVVAALGRAGRMQDEQHTRRQVARERAAMGPRATAA